jgi:hypothetical protein
MDRGPVGLRRRLAAFPVTGQREMLAFLTTHTTLAARFAERNVGGG